MIHPVLSPLGPEAKFAPETEVLARLVADWGPSEAIRAAAVARAVALIGRLRSAGRPGMMEQVLAQYSLSSREGVALMCLAEALLRVPDAGTIDALIEDKIAPSDWGRHLGTAASPLVNASTWALMLTGKVLGEGEGVAGTLRALMRRLGEPVIRLAVGQAMKEMGRQFVLGETIEKALERAQSREAQGYTLSYDMLGEAALTAGDAARYRDAYARAIAAIGAAAKGASVHDNSGISIKLSALHPRYEVAQEARVMAELVPVVQALARQAAAAGIALHVDAEEQDRLALSLRVMDAVMADPETASWQGFGAVVQAYGKRAAAAIDTLFESARRHDRRINIRLVKGAYWDSEMKRAQVEGHPGFPLFTSKVATDAAYLCLAAKLFTLSERIFPQFATHNAHTVAAVQELAAGRPFEFQRLHGMGAQLHDMVLAETGGRCRIYAPVGAHRDLLAYLVRRLLENGANASFVHQIVDPEVPAERIAACPFERLAQAAPPRGLVAPAALFGGGRANSRGFDLSDPAVLAAIDAARACVIPDAEPLTAGPAASGARRAVVNPATGAEVAQVTEAVEATVSAAIDAAQIWAVPAAERAAVLCRAADLYEENFGPIFATLAREAGKTLPDAVSELREAVDFIRYYADQGAGEARAPRGRIVAISPWNFPLAIFTGQIAAALMAGNAVLAKPAEQTPLIAAMAVRLLHRAGVPREVLQLLPGDGATVGAALTRDPRIAGVVFTGSTETAQIIARAMAAHMAPGTPLIAETGGLNAMVVDSTALPEQAVRDIIASAFRSAGQRCSALRCLYVQQDIAPRLLEMLRGAMDELRLGDPWQITTDVGPVIDGPAQTQINAWVAAHEDAILHRIPAPSEGHFIGPVLLKINGIEDMNREIFGPVLHFATFSANALPQVIAAVNACGFGLTFGLHSRIDGRVEEVAAQVHAGNLYVNRNQIGAVVGSQPFGGEGRSGTGPKAGGPLYLNRFFAPDAPDAGVMAAPMRSEIVLPGPTGELNRLSLHPRAPVLCLGPGAENEASQIAAVRALGGRAKRLDAPMVPGQLTEMEDISAVLWWGDDDRGRAFAQALAARPGAIVPLLTARPDAAHVLHERHLCVDTTAAGGNAALLAS